MASTIRTDKIGPADGSADFTLPTADGSAKSALITDGSKALSFATGTPSASNFLRGDGTWAAAGGGKLLQVLQSVKTDTATTTVSTTTFADIAGTDQAGAGSIWCVKITPAATTSKILVSWEMNVGAGNNMRMNTKIQRDSADVLLGDTASNRVRVSAQTTTPYVDGMSQNSMQYLDSPSTTSEVEYKVVWNLKVTSADLYLF